mgnify:CR=1 FL=1
MRDSLSALRLLFCMLAAFVLAAPITTDAQTHSNSGDISGIYLLYREGDLGGKVVASMRITTALPDGRFSIGNAVPTGNPSLDWKGTGVLEGAGGHYSWIFNNGKRGMTTFRIDRFGNLHGKVRGPGVNWDYVARKQ